MGSQEIEMGVKYHVVCYCHPVEKSLTLHLIPCWYLWVSSIKEKRTTLDRNTEHAGTQFSDVSKSDIHLVTSTIVIIFCSIEE